MTQLVALTLSDWKSFGETRNRIDFAPLTLLVGPNASGKSNALDALRFLQGWALDYPLGDVLRGRWEGQREVWPAIRGQTVEAARSGATRFSLKSEWLCSPVGAQGKSAEHFIAVDLAQDVSLIEEGVRRGQGPAFPAAREVQRALRGTVFLDIEPARMRDYRPEHARALGTSGENVSSILAGIDDAARADILDWLGELCEPSLEAIEFDRTQLKEVMFFLREKGGRQVSARSVSDGTLRFLGLVTALLTAEPESLIVLEEPDVGLHPSRIHLLARLLEQVTSQRGIQIVATTHSPTLLAHLSPESLGNVVALGRDAEARSVCARLRDLPYFETLRDSKELEHLVSTGWIERAL